MTKSLAQTIALITKNIPANVRLVVITKQVKVEPMRSAYAAGVKDFGENRLQEALSKQEQLKDLPDITWHFIGHIQKNKAKKVIENFEWIHSVDSLALAQRLDKIAIALRRRPKILLQVKMLPDPNKYGWQVEELQEDLSALNQCEQLDIQGLMTILPLGLSPDEVSAAFQNAKKLAIAIKAKKLTNLTMKQLSMGMSGDYLPAIAAGATMIRLGRTIFGERNQ